MALIIAACSCGKLGYDPLDPRPTSSADSSTSGSFGFGGHGGTWPDADGAAAGAGGEPVPPPSDAGDPREGWLPCPPSYAPSLIGCYRFVATPMSWLNAETNCEQDGAHLVVTRDRSEDTWLASIVTGESTWLGITDTLREGQFVPVTGEPLTFTNWGANEPSNSMGQEDIVELRADVTWNDVDFLAVHPYVCQFDGATSPGPFPAGNYCNATTQSHCGECGKPCPFAMFCSSLQVCQ